MDYSLKAKRYPLISIDNNRNRFGCTVMRGLIANTHYLFCSGNKLFRQVSPVLLQSLSAIRNFEKYTPHLEKETVSQVKSNACMRYRSTSTKVYSYSQQDPVTERFCAIPMTSNVFEKTSAV